MNFLANSIYGGFAEPGPFAQCTANQILRQRGLQPRKSLFTRQPSEVIGEQVSDLPPRRWGAWDIYGIKKQGGLRPGERWLEVGKRWGKWCSVQAYLSCMLLHRMHIKKWWHLAQEFLALWRRGHSLDTCAGPVLGSVVLSSFTWLSSN